MKGKTILITGGAGFIGSHLVRFMVNQYPEIHFVNFDVLTYAGNTEKLKDADACVKALPIKLTGLTAA